MAGICWFAQPHRMLPLPRLSNNHGVQCCSNAPNNPNSKKEKTQTPKLLKLAVNGATEVLRLSSPSEKYRLDTTNRQTDETLVSNIDDILMIIKSDYEKAYFVTGILTSEIYADDCTFEDPTIKFQGRDLYLRNLKLLVPFFDNPSIFLKDIEKSISSETKYIVASWKLRIHSTRTCFMKLPFNFLEISQTENGGAYMHMHKGQRNVHFHLHLNPSQTSMEASNSD